jgi:hypothetical protein
MDHPIECRIYQPNSSHDQFVLSVNWPKDKVLPPNYRIWVPQHSSPVRLQFTEHSDRDIGLI